MQVVAAWCTVQQLLRRQSLLLHLGLVAPCPGRPTLLKACPMQDLTCVSLIEHPAQAGQAKHGQQSQSVHAHT